MQPKWRYLGNLGDASPLDYNGLFVFADETGVYAPTMEYLERYTPDDSDEDRDRYYVYRVSLEPCTYENGVLSDNQYHKSHSAWFAKYLPQVASCAGIPMDQLVDSLASFSNASDDASIMNAAVAYRAIFDCHGWENGDSYPLDLSRSEVKQRYKAILKGSRVG